MKCVDDVDVDDSDGGLEEGDLLLLRILWEK